MSIEGFAASTKTPSLPRRAACMLYEGLLLFGVVAVATYLFSSLTQQRHALVGKTSLQAFLFLVLGIYFVWFWSHGGQTLAMKTWRIRVINNGAATSPSQPRALARYVLSWSWFLPALATIKFSEIRSGTAILATLLTGVVVYAMLSLTNTKHQYLHDIVCGTCLITWPPSGSPLPSQ